MVSLAAPHALMDPFAAGLARPSVSVALAEVEAVAAPLTVSTGALQADECLGHPLALAGPLAPAGAPVDLSCRCGFRLCLGRSLFQLPLLLRQGVVRGSLVGGGL